MKYFLTLTLLFSYIAYCGCSDDPFADGCDNVNSKALDVASDIVCNNGYKINKDGEVKDTSGNVIAQKGSITSAAKTLSACDEYGGTAAVAKQNNNIQIQLNTNNIASASSAGASAASGAGAASASGTAADTELVMTTTSTKPVGNTGDGGATKDPNYWRATSDPPGSCCSCTQCISTCPVSNPTTSKSWADWSAANCGGSTGGSTDGGSTTGPKSTTTTTSGGSTTGGSGVTCDPGIRKYKDVDKCCPASYPNTGTDFGCCQNGSGTQICLQK